MPKITETGCVWLFFPPKEVFVEPEKAYGDYQGIQTIKLRGWEIDLPEEGGMFFSTPTEKHPFPGIICPQILQMVAIVKREIIVRLRKLKNPLNIFKIRQWIKEIEELSSVSLAKYYIKPQYYCRYIRELRRVLLLIFPGFSSIIEILAMILEFDSHYRFITQAFLGNLGFQKARYEPRKAILKELDFAVKECDNYRVKPNWILAKKLFKTAWLFPNVRSKIKQFFKEIKFTEIYMSEADQYHQFK